MTIWDTLGEPDAATLTAIDLDVVATIHDPPLVVGSLSIENPSIVQATLRLGEAVGSAYAWTLGEAEAQAIAQRLRDGATSWIEAKADPTRLLAHAATLREERTAVGQAVSALLEIAVADAGLRADGRTLLDWPFRADSAEQRVYYSDIYDSYSDAQVIEGLQWAMRAGLAGVKVRLGVVDLDWISTRLRLVRDAVGSEMALMVDAVTNWTPDFAAAAADVLATYNTQWLEDPFPPDALDELAWLCARSPVPLCAGELCQSADEIDSLIEVGLSVVMLDLQHLGGLSETMRAVQAVRDAGRRLTFHVFPEIGACIAPELQDWVEYAPLWNRPVPPIANGGRLRAAPCGVFAYQGGMP